MSAAKRARRLGATLVSPARQITMLALDGLLAVGSLILAVQLRFDGAVPSTYAETLPLLALMLVPIRIATSTLLRLHRWSFRFSGLADAARIGLAGFLGSVAFTGLSFTLVTPRPPRSVIVLELLMTTLWMTALRFGPRLAGLYVGDWRRSRRDGSLRTIIAGAGAAGEMLLRDLQRSPDHDYQIVGFVDDDRSRRNAIVGGKTVLGTIDDLPRIAQSHRVEQVLIAIPRLPGRRVREILSICADVKLRFKILPVSFAYFSRKAASSVMQDLSPDDLLPRAPIRLSQTGQPCEGRIALVTGAAGSIGSEICKQLCAGGIGRLVMVDQNESGLYLLQRRLERDHPKTTLLPEIADICDEGRIRSLFKRYKPQDVFHAAANKHVPLMEIAPSEAIKTNVQGTRSVATLAHLYRADRFVLISTDKAVRPTSVMGASKQVCEKIVQALGARSTTFFGAVRFGNVLGSAGSVVPIFQEQIAQGGPVTVTHPEVRRYFMTIQEAVALVLHAGYAEFGSLCVLDMGEQIRIVDLARHMITMSGLTPDADIAIEFSGLRPGEKLYEELMTEEEERTRRVDNKILAAEARVPEENLNAQVDALIEAGRANDDSAVRAGLHRLVPSYSVPGDLPAAASGDAGA